MQVNPVLTNRPAIQETHAGDRGSVPLLGKSSGEGNGNPLKYSCLGNPMDRGACQATVHGVRRVRHDIVTKPLPPSQVVPRIFAK